MGSCFRRSPVQESETDPTDTTATGSGHRCGWVSLQRPGNLAEPTLTASKTLVGGGNRSDSSQTERPEVSDQRPSRCPRRDDAGSKSVPQVFSGKDTVSRSRLGRNQDPAKSLVLVRKNGRGPMHELRCPPPARTERPERLQNSIPAAVSDPATTRASQRSWESSKTAESLRAAVGTRVPTMIGEKRDHNPAVKAAPNTADQRNPEGKTGRLCRLAKTYSKLVRSSAGGRLPSSRPTRTSSRLRGKSSLDASYCFHGLRSPLTELGGAARTQPVAESRRATSMSSRKVLPAPVHGKGHFPRFDRSTAKTASDRDSMRTNWPSVLSKRDSSQAQGDRPKLLQARVRLPVLRESGDSRYPQKWSGANIVPRPRERRRVLRRRGLRDQLRAAMRRRLRDRQGADSSKQSTIPMRPSPYRHNTRAPNRVGSFTKNRLPRYGRMPVRRTRPTRTRGRVRSRNVTSLNVRGRRRRGIAARLRARPERRSPSSTPPSD